MLCGVKIYLILLSLLGIVNAYYRKVIKNKEKFSIINSSKLNFYIYNSPGIIDLLNV